MLSNICLNMALDGSGSHVGNTISFISHRFSIPRRNIVYRSASSYVMQSDVTLYDTGSVIRDLLEKRIDMFNSVETRDILFILCTE